MEQVYNEAGVSPADVAYVEAHGTGTQAGDPQELNAIADVFCTKQRSRPLLIGSVKSNAGHTEPVSGEHLSAVCTKFVMSFNVPQPYDKPSRRNS